ncbi:hypothetical protein F0L68_22335 [Solihabitans fulvus]|uniref:Uncharacterized protein n=1 Tax=Solihabitans fulvus TaxID=1892852 RepID=A0A5B2X6W8_9PSEU|nr:hypothetical protein F0L68_22335 [Solihabitans fulvus]
MSAPAVSRRGVLVVGALTALAAPLAVACSTPEPPLPPDPLTELAVQARADAAAAAAIASAQPGLAEAAGLVATNRGEHAKVLQAELDRARPPSPSSSAAPTKSAAPTPPPPDPQSAKTALTDALTAAEKKASELVLTLPNFRAGLVGSIAAGCAALREAVR